MDDWWLSDDDDDGAEVQVDRSHISRAAREATTTAADAPPSDGPSVPSLAVNSLHEASLIVAALDREVHWWREANTRNPSALAAGETAAAADLAYRARAVVREWLARERREGRG